MLEPKRRSAPRSVAAFLVMLVFALWPGGPTEAQKAPVRIGAVHNVSGPLASIGQPSLAGARLAVRQLNERGGLLGRPVELISGDGRSDPAVVAAITSELVRTPHIAAITGLNDTTMALAAAPIAEQARVVFLTSGATSPRVPSQFPRFYFMACFGDNTQAAAGAEYAYDVLGARTAWLLFDHTADYTILLAGYFKARFTELGGAIVGEDTYPGGAPDFSGQIGRILALPTLPDVLYLSAGPDDVGRLVNRMREAGIDRPIVGGDGYDTPLLLEAAGAAADNTYFTTHAFLDPRQATPLGRQFIADYGAEYGAPPETAFAALGYDAVLLVASAIERAGSAEPAAIRDALEATAGFPGVTGVISFEPGVHLPRKEVWVVKVDGEMLTLASVLEPRNVPAP